MMSDAFRFRKDGGEEQRRTDGRGGIALHGRAADERRAGKCVGRSVGRMVGRADGVPPKRTTIAVQQGQRIAEG